MTREKKTGWQAKNQAKPGDKRKKIELVILSAAKNPALCPYLHYTSSGPMREHEYYVYILASTFHRLYIGVTNDLEVRVKQHKNKKAPNSFTARYGIDRPVYFERFQ